MAEVPEYAKTPEGKVDWTREGVADQRKEYYDKLYTESVQARAKLQTERLFQDIESNVKLDKYEIKKGDTLSQILLDTVAQGSRDLMKQALKNLQSAGFQVDLIRAGYTIEIVNNRLTIRDENDAVYVDRDSGTPVQDLKVFDIGSTGTPGDENPDEDAPGNEEPPAETPVPGSEKLTPDEQFQLDWKEKEAEMRTMLDQINNPEGGEALTPPVTMSVVEAHGRRGNSKEITLHRGGLEEKVRVTILFWGHTEYREQILERFQRNVDNLNARYDRKEGRYEAKDKRLDTRLKTKTDRLEGAANEAAAEGNSGKALRKKQHLGRVEGRFAGKESRLDERQTELSTSTPEAAPTQAEALDPELEEAYRLEVTDKVKTVFKRKFGKEIADRLEPKITVEGQLNPSTDRWDMTVTYDLLVDGVSKSTGVLNFAEEKAFKKLRTQRVANDIVRENEGKDAMREILES